MGLQKSKQVLEDVRLQIIISMVEISTHFHSDKEYTFPKGFQSGQAPAEAGMLLSCHILCVFTPHWAAL